MCVCVCVCVYTHTHTHTHIYIYIYIYICIYIYIYHCHYAFIMLLFFNCTCIFQNMYTSPVQKSRTGMAYRCYSPSAVTNAYFAVTESCESIKGTARKFGIPEATLRDRVRGRISVDVTKSGKDPLFTLEEERALVEHLKVMSSYG